MKIMNCMLLYNLIYWFLENGNKSQHLVGLTGGFIRFAGFEKTSISFICWGRGFTLGSWKLWGGNSVLGRKFGARTGLWMFIFKVGTAGLSVLSISFPKYVASGAVEPGEAA